MNCTTKNNQSLGIDIKGNDSKIFSAVPPGRTDIPIFVNHTSYSRVTPTSNHYNLDVYEYHKYKDLERKDSTEGLKDILLNNKVTYVVGGHLTNLASLLKKYPEQANNIQEVVISSGWSRVDKYVKETNLSVDTNAEQATHFVFKNFKNTITMCSPLVETFWDINILNPKGGFKYLLEHGTYYNAKKKE